MGLILFCLYVSVSESLFSPIQGPDSHSKGSCVDCVAVNHSIHCFPGKGHSDFFTLSSALSQCALQMLSCCLSLPPCSQYINMCCNAVWPTHPFTTIVQHCALMPSLMHLKAVLGLFHLSQCLPIERLVNRYRGHKSLTAMPPGPDHSKISLWFLLYKQQAAFGSLWRSLS